MDNRSWKLESFVDSLVVELDKTRETLAVKSINKPLTYSVKDVSLELQIFPTYDGDNVEFRTAQPGQEGASKISIQLASITDQQVRATTKEPPKKGSVRLDEVEMDPETKKDLRRLGVTSADDLAEIEKRDVEIPGNVAGADYKNLANLIQKARRSKTPPVVKEASLLDVDGGRRVRLRGANLSVSASHTPVAVLNGRLVSVVRHASDAVDIDLGSDAQLGPENELILTLDPYCIARMVIRGTEVRT